MSTTSTYGPAAAPVSRFRVVWMPIPASAYEANTLGMIRNARTKRPLTPFSDRDGYLLVEILQAGRQGLHYVHRLVLLAFAGDPPTPRHQAAHADGCRQHNAVWNLRWATPRENAADRRRHRTIRKATLSARRRPSRHKSLDTLRGYVRRAELFKDHAGAGFLQSPPRAPIPRAMSGPAGSRVRVIPRSAARSQPGSRPGARAPH